MRRFATLALVATMAASTAACTDTTGPSGPLQGTYSLRTIDGRPLPYQMSSGARLLEEELTLFSDETYEVVSYFDFGPPAIEQGYYSNSNGALDFESDDGDVFQGSLSGDILTQVRAGFTQVYRRE